MQEDRNLCRTLRNSFFKWVSTYWSQVWCLTCQSKGRCSGWARGDGRTHLCRSSEGSRSGWTLCLSQGSWLCRPLDGTRSIYQKSEETQKKTDMPTHFLRRSFIRAEACVHTTASSVSLTPSLFLTDLLDAFFVLDQQLHSGDVDV